DDFAIASPPAEIRLYAGGPSLNFPLLGTVASAYSFNDLGAAADVDQDGKLDLIMGSDHAPGVCVAVGHGDGTFGEASGTTYPLPYFPTQVEMADFDGDLQLDAAVRVQGQSSIDIYLTGVGGAPSAGPSIALPRAATSFAIGDMN